MKEEKYTLKEWREFHNAKNRQYWKDNPDKYQHQLIMMQKWRKRHPNYHKEYLRNHKEEHRQAMQRWLAKRKAQQQ